MTWAAQSGESAGLRTLQTCKRESVGQSKDSAHSGLRDAWLEAELGDGLSMQCEEVSAEKGHHGGDHRRPLPDPVRGLDVEKGCWMDVK